MMTKRVLNTWRKEALIEVYIHQDRSGKVFTTDSNTWRILHQRILNLTQELLDLQVIQEHKEKESKYVR